MKKDEQNVRQFGDTIMYSNVCIMKIPEGKRENNEKNV